jgi:hypothetical protein
MTLYPFRVVQLTGKPHRSRWGFFLSQAGNTAETVPE